MIRKFSDVLLAQLQAELEELSFAALDPLTRKTSAIACVDRALKKLRRFSAKHPFECQEEEVDYFKHILPGFCCWQVYFCERYTIEESIPGDVELQLGYFERELVYIERFFRQHAFIYQYYKLGGVELDAFYFLAATDREGPLLGVPLEMGSGTGTVGDKLFAKIMAFEMLRDWVHERIGYLKRHPLLPYQPGMVAVDVRWTGESVDLAELALGLYLSGRINHGSASMSSIFRWLEEQLQVSIGVPSRRLAAIRQRKLLSRTHFLDEMRELVSRKLEKGDG
jgi:hypothetical protein